MKKKITIILILAMILPAVVLADPAEPSDRYSTFGATEDVGNIFPGKYFAIDLFMSYDLNAYIFISTWEDHDVTTKLKQAAIKSKNEEPGILYFLFPDGSYYRAWYDDDTMQYIWLDIDGHCIRMKFSQWLVPHSDYKEE